MCETCGCSSDKGTLITDLKSGRHIHLSPEGEVQVHAHHHAHHHAHDHGHDHDDAHPHAHEHGHDSGQDHSHSHSHASETGRVVRLEQELLSKNERLAERNRGWFAARDVGAFNLMSSPGAGKTTLLERTIRDLGKELSIQVIEGDQETTRDAERIRNCGCSVVQINTGAGCHLDASMVSHALRQLDPPPGSVLLIENVGNLVCPALFDLGERARVVVASVTEGDDKPAKYPHMFRSAQLILLNKVDLLPHVEFDLAAFEQAAHALNPNVRLLQISARRGDGLNEWYEWIRRNRGTDD